MNVFRFLVRNGSTDLSELLSDGPAGSVARPRSVQLPSRSGCLPLPHAAPAGGKHSAQTAEVTATSTPLPRASDCHQDISWQDAINSVVIKEILVPRWEIAIRVPIEILVRGQKAFAYPSRSDLARLKIERGHRAGRAGVEPDVTMEVREPSKPGLKEVRLVEVTLVEDFTAKGDFAEHKIQQFTSDVMIMREKYDPGLPVKYTFIAPRPPTPATKAFILGTLKSQGATNFTVVWLVVKT